MNTRNNSNDCIIIAGKIYSSNLGDSIIAESMGFLFRKMVPDLKIDFLDLSIRSSWLPQHSFSNTAWNNIKDKKALKYLRNYILFYLFRHKKYLQHWQSVILNPKISDLIIGGGQLLMDNCLQFPLEINHLTQTATRFGVKSVHFVACGVGAKWSTVAASLFREAISRASTITVRDHLSANRLSQFMPEVSPSVTFDPAIWASDIYKVEKKNKKGFFVGLGVTNIPVLNFHANENEKLSRKGCIDFWIELIAKIHRQGMDFELFTNGEVSDFMFAREISEAVKRQLALDCPLARQPVRPIELVQCISRYSAIVAARLHANIIATSYGIPSVGLSWDNKVLAFYTDTERKELCLNVYKCIPSVVLDTIIKARDLGVSSAMIDHVKQLALKNIHIVLESLKS